MAPGEVKFLRAYGILHRCRERSVSASVGFNRWGRRDGQSSRTALPVASRPAGGAHGERPRSTRNARSGRAGIRCCAPWRLSLPASPFRPHAQPCRAVRMQSLPGCDRHPPQQFLAACDDGPDVVSAAAYTFVRGGRLPRGGRVNSNTFSPYHASSGHVSVTRSAPRCCNCRSSFARSGAVRIRLAAVRPSAHLAAPRERAAPRAVLAAGELRWLRASVALPRSRGFRRRLAGRRPASAHREAK